MYVHDSVPHVCTGSCDCVRLAVTVVGCTKLCIYRIWMLQAGTVDFDFVTYLLNLVY